MKSTHTINPCAALLFICGALTTGISNPASAHPMGNFSINHYTKLTVEKGRLTGRFILDMAEVPTVDELLEIDRNGDGKISDAEKSAYLATRVPDLLARLRLTANDRPVALKTLSSEVALRPGAAGLHTLRIRVDFSGIVTGGAKIVFADDSFPNRTGWREIVAGGSRDAILLSSSVPTTDLSNELTSYPANVSAPQVRTATFSIGAGAGTPVTAVHVSPIPAQAPTPRDAFTEAISHRQLTPAVLIAGLMIAFVFGAFHALSPGHGKAMVAAYLVGARGTARHAVALGIIVTITHTLGVFALGIVTLFLSSYIVPEKLYPILGTISGLAVVGVGATLLWRNVRGVSDGHHHQHPPDHEHVEEDHHHHEHDHAHADHYHDELGNTVYLTHSHSHEHEHEHDHDHDHAHDHGHGHSHGFGHHHHHHVPEGPITARSLLALGISGGIVPCPSALVVLLSAVALHRVAYGLGLITAFSVGLASVLVAIGLMVVWAREWLDRLPAAGGIMRRLPVASAGVITIVGLVLLVKAWS